MFICKLAGLVLHIQLPAVKLRRVHSSDMLPCEVDRLPYVRMINNYVLEGLVSICGKKEGLIATRWARSMVLPSPSSTGAAAPLVAGVDRPTLFCWLSPPDLCRLAAGFVAWVEHVL